MGDLWLIGMPGSGKSTVGELVAGSLGKVFLDIDRLIEEEIGKSIDEIFSHEGEEAFRRVESAKVQDLATKAVDYGGGRVISTGGGVVLDDRCVEAMRRTGVVVWLDASISSLTARLGEGRPLLAGSGASTRLRTMLAHRRPLYERAAHYRVDADRPLSALVTETSLYARVPVGDSSEVLIAPELPARLLPSSSEREKAVVIAQVGALPVARQVMDRLESETDPTLIEVPDREEAKTLQSLGRLYTCLAELNLGRHDTIVGVGGGATTDVAGFAAATWLRGIESVLVPTTLLGAVDASIGGKTGINVFGKNLVGAFWHPTRVIVSTDVLATLPEELLREGSAEAVKAGFIADPHLVDIFMTHGLSFPSTEVVRRAVTVKASVVSGDFREVGNRAILNFGHTIGHGVEVVCGLPHGYAVSVGMVAAAAISKERYGFDADVVVSALRRLGLPTRVEGADRVSVMRMVSRDKKRTPAGLRMVLLRRIGDPVVELVDESAVKLGLDSIGIDR